jgi:hypothetical protein
MGGECDQRQAQRDQEAFLDTHRRRYVVLLTSLVIGALGWQLGLAGWQIGLAMGGVYIGLTMAVGLASKWW